jgi:hypothetical protein
MKKVYVKDFNNILIPVIDKLKEKNFELVEDPRDSDVLVTWQDVRGDMYELAHINSEYMHKPLVVVQHGRAATNDYLPPNAFKMNATKFCCWGEKDYERLDRAGLKDRAVVTGSSLVGYIKPKEPHDGKNIVYVPVVTSHEEPENIEAYWHLKSIELKRSIAKLNKCKESLKNEWNAWVVESTSATEGTIPYYNFNKDWRLIAKLTDIHDKKLYFGDIVQTSQGNTQHLVFAIRLLQMSDCVVGIEEGTFQLLAMAMDIPVVMVDGFKYKEYGGIDYSSVEMVKTTGVRRVDLSDVEKTIDEELANPEHLNKERERVVREELYDGSLDPIDNIVNVIKGVL